MYKFKEGDVIIRNTGEKKGQLATVLVGASDREYMTIRWHDPDTEARGGGGGWDPRNFALYQHPIDKPEEIKVPYRFKVGDTGKTRAGKTYRVLALDVKNETGRTIVAAVTLADGINETICRVAPNGRLYADGGDTPSDLLLPTITVYQLSCSNRKQALADGEIGEESVLIATFKSEKQVNKRKEELLKYYENIIVTPIEREQA